MRIFDYLKLHCLQKSIKAKNYNTSNRIKGSESYLSYKYYIDYKNHVDYEKITSYKSKKDYKSCEKFYR